MADQASDSKSDKLQRRCFQAGAWIFVLVFLGHMAGQLATDYGPSSEAQARVYEAMAAVQGMEGSPRTVHDFYRGNSYGMGLMILAFGALNLLLARALGRAALALPRTLIVFAAGVAWLMVALSARFFPVPPIIFLTVAGVLFSIAAAQRPAGS